MASKGLALEILRELHVNKPASTPSIDRTHHKCPSCGNRPGLRRNRCFQCKQLLCGDCFDKPCGTESKHRRWPRNRSYVTQKEKIEALCEKLDRDSKALTDLVSKLPASDERDAMLAILCGWVGVTPRSFRSTERMKRDDRKRKAQTDSADLRKLDSDVHRGSGSAHGMDCPEGDRACGCPS
jgi:hypothetical protein